MGTLLQICPECSHWFNHEKANTCSKCGANLTKFSGKVWAIDYRDADYRRRRKKIGPNKTAARQALREAESATAEKRHIRVSPDFKTTFRELAKWYLGLSEVKAKRSYDRDERSVKRLLQFFGNKLLKDITPSLVENYKHERLAEPSYRGHNTKPASVNRELACLKTIFNKGIKNDRAERTPMRGVKMLKENNKRERVLSREEYQRLLAQSAPWLKPVLVTAYHTGMRLGEIVNLTWGHIDLKEGFIHLRPEDTKTNEGRAIPLRILSNELNEMLKKMPRGLPGANVFTRDGKPISSLRVAFEGACQRAQVDGFTFHDFRRTAETNMRRAGIDPTIIMAILGHKSTAMFMRYNTVSREELKSLGEKFGESGQYLDSN